METYDILTLDDHKDYALVETKDYEGATYCLLVEVDQDENPLENTVILKKVLVNDTEFELEEIDEEDFAEIAELFTEEELED